MSILTFEPDYQNCPNAASPEVLVPLLGGFGDFGGRVRTTHLIWQDQAYDIWVLFADRIWKLYLFRVLEEKASQNYQASLVLEIKDDLSGKYIIPTDGFPNINDPFSIRYVGMHGPLDSRPDIGRGEALAFELFDLLVHQPLPQNALRKAYLRAAGSEQFACPFFHPWIGPTDNNDVEESWHGRFGINFDWVFAGKHLLNDGAVDILIRVDRDDNDIVSINFVSWDRQVVIRRISKKTNTNARYEFAETTGSSPKWMPFVANVACASLLFNKKEQEIPAEKIDRLMFELGMVFDFFFTFKSAPEKVLIARSSAFDLAGQPAEVMAQFQQTEDEFGIRKPMEFPSWERPFVLSNASFSDFRTPRSHFDGAALEATPGLHAGVEAEFIGRVIWFGQEADLWIFKRTFIKGNTEFGFKLIAPDKGIESIGQESEIIEEFIIPESSLGLCTELNRLGPKRQKATVQLIAFIKQCKLADTFLRENDIH